MKPVVLKFMDCNMKHVTPQDKVILKEVADTFQYGFQVVVPHPCNHQAYMDQGYSRALWELLMIAFANGCDHLQLDEEGTVYKDLPIF